MFEYAGMIVDFLGFWPQVWSSFLTLTPVEQITNALALVAPAWAVGILALRRVVRSRTTGLEKQVDGLKGQVEGLQIELRDDRRKFETRRADLQAELDQATEIALTVPAKALERAHRERADGNEERAIEALRGSFEALKPDLSRLCTDLALHHVALAPDFGDHNLVEAARLAEIACQLDPTDEAAADARAELAETTAARAMAGGVYDPLDPIWDDQRFFMRIGAEDDAAAAFGALVAKGYNEGEAGRYQLAERILRRAIAIGNRLYGPTDERTLRAVWPWLASLSGLDKPASVLEFATDLSSKLGSGTAEKGAAEFAACKALGGLGRYEEALRRLLPNIRLWKLLRGNDDPETLSNRNLRCQLLSQIGDTKTALTEVKGVLSARQRVSGPEDSDTLGTRHVFARLLQQTADFHAALAEVETLLLVEERLRGAEHPDTLATRWLRASLLRDTGDTDAALAEVQAILPIQARTSGAEHPDTLTTRWLRASLLRDTGDAAAALAEIETSLPVENRVRGAGHPDTLTTRYLRASLLRDTGDTAAALAEVEALLPIRAGVSGAEHPDTLATRWLRASLLRDTGDTAAALAEVEALLPVEERVRGVEHPFTLFTRILRAEIWSQTGKRDSAATELKAILPLLRQKLGEDDRNVREAVALLAELQPAQAAE